MHPRTMIRRDTAQRLIAAFTPADDAPEGSIAVPVDTSRFLPSEEASLPRLLVYTPRSRANAQGRASGAPAFEDTLTLIVEVVVAAHGDAETEDQLDVICEGVENALLQDTSWFSSNYIEQVVAIDTDTQASKPGSKRHYLAARISFSLRFRTQFPPAPLGQLDGLRVHVAPLQPRDTSQPFPPPAWREQPHIAVDLPSED